MLSKCSLSAKHFNELRVLISCVRFTGPLLHWTTLTLSQDWGRQRGFWPKSLWRVLNRVCDIIARIPAFINSRDLKMIPGLWNLKHANNPQQLGNCWERAPCEHSVPSVKPTAIPWHHCSDFHQTHTFLLSPCFRVMFSMLLILLPINMFSWTTIFCPSGLHLEVEKQRWCSRTRLTADNPGRHYKRQKMSFLGNSHRS